MLNTLPTSSTRQPRAVVKVNGQVVTGWKEFEVDNNSFYMADTFRCKFAINALPAAFNPDWWASQSSIYIELFVGFPADPEHYSASELQSIFYGQVDDLTYPPASRCIEVSGRDLTAELIDAKTYEQFVNQTASQIATTLAIRHGLTPVVTATTVKAGTYYQLENRRIPLDRSEWDLLTWLAGEESFSVYVSGQSLHFEPATLPTADPYVLQWNEPTADIPYPTFNGTDITFSRNLTLAKDIIVFVHSWNPKQAKGFTVKAQATHDKNTVLSGAAQPVGKAQTYSFVRPGLTREEAQKFANAKLQELSAHEVRFSAVLPGDNIIGMTNVIQVKGTGTAFDQIYYPDSIVRRISADEGYVMTVTAKNHSPESEVLA